MKIAQKAVDNSAAGESRFKTGKFASERLRDFGALGQGQLAVSGVGEEGVTGDRKKLLEAVSTDAYNGVDLFEGTTPMAAQQEPGKGAVDLGDTRDAGVDISSLLGGASHVWDQMNRKTNG